MAGCWPRVGGRSDVAAPSWADPQPANARSTTALRMTARMRPSLRSPFLVVNQDHVGATMTHTAIRTPVTRLRTALSAGNFRLCSLARSVAAHIQPTQRADRIRRQV